MQVRVTLLGRFEVSVDQHEIPGAHWRRRDASALVKVLALARDRRLHREQLLDVLWPDLDPHAAAPRLHKAVHFARRALAVPDAVTVEAELVCLLPKARVFVDATELERAGRAALTGSEAAALDVLDRYPGELLPGDRYAEWAEEPRARVDRLRRDLMRHAGRWEDLVQLDPLDEGAHVEAVRAIARSGDRTAALRRLEELQELLRRELGVEPGSDVLRLHAQLEAGLQAQPDRPTAQPGRVRQQIRFCRTDDGVTLAYAISGSGPPLVKAANWMTHVDYDWQSPVWRHWLVGLSQKHQLVRYDERGCGLSDWDVGAQTFDSWVRDLETVVDNAGLDRFPLLGISQGGAVAVTYAARHPERVTRLVLYGTYVHGRLARAGGEEDRREHELQVELARLGWGKDTPALRQVFTAQFMPEGSRELWDQFNELQRNTTSAENAAAVLAATGYVNVSEEARAVRVPTLVLHARHDQRPPFEQGRLMASLIPDSRFVALESCNHILLGDEPAWQVFLTEVERFLAE